MVAWWPPANTTFGPTWIFLHLQTWTDTSSPSLTNQRMIIIHHCLAPSRLGMTKHPKLSLSHSCPLPPCLLLSQLRTLCWEPWGPEQSGLPMASSQEGQISLAALLPFHTARSQFLIPMLSFSLPPWGSASSKVSSLQFIWFTHKTVISFPEAILALHHTIFNS